MKMLFAVLMVVVLSTAAWATKTPVKIEDECRSDAQIYAEILLRLELLEMQLALMESNLGIDSANE